MTVHYHGTPITPAATLVKLAGRHFCVSHMRPDNVEWCHNNGQSVMLDNGAFSKVEVRQGHRLAGLLCMVRPLA
jgi:hypothetical protein